jgi:hypothetical protein
MGTSYGLMRAVLAAGLVWVVLLGATACSVAWAGAYHVFGCRMPDGLVAPVDGWSGSISLSETVDHVADSCSTGGGLVAALRSGRAHTANTDLATWHFNAPSGETLQAATLWRAGDTAGGGNSNDSYLFWLTGVANRGENTVLFDMCNAFKGCHEEGNLEDPLAASNRIEAPAKALHSSYLSLNASCESFVSGSECASSPGDISGYATTVELFAADLVLDQESSPTVQNVSGSLAEAAAVGGTADVTFTATDPGSGVYQAVFLVDGVAISSKVLDANGGHCRDVGQTTDGLPAFLYTQPCKPSLSEDVPFDTTSLSDGPHHLVVSVTNAAGNATPVVDRQVTVANAHAPAGGGGGQSGGAGQSSPGTTSGTNAPLPARGAANGSEASEQAALAAQWRGAVSVHITSAFGAAHAVQGRLTTAGGRAIAGAIVDVSLIPAAAGAHPLVLPAAHTASDGRFTLMLPRTISGGALRLGYRSHLGDTTPVATRTLTLGVRAGIHLHIYPTMTSAGHTIRFAGRLRGGPVPSGGKQLVLEARSPGGRWIEFNVVRSDAHGNFHASYRFRFPGPAFYSFRVLSNSEADYPYLAGASNVVGVRER